VAIAAALLSPRLIAVVVVAGLAARLAAAISGEVNVVSAIAEMSAMLVIALVGRDAAVNFVMAEQGALHDVLTGLPNRRLFMDRLEHAIRQAERQKESVCLLILDLDGFKAVNDSLGHHGGDRLLQLVTQALLVRLRDSDTLARLGGDEFAVLLAGSGGISHGVGAADRVRRALGDPFSIGGTPVQVQASVGIAVYPECGNDAVALMRSADDAMYAAKRAGQPYEVGRQTEPST
jgi:diguanylate cyclase (GGDEF)-like protein